MARKDVIDYYLQQQKVYLKMLALAKRVDDDYARGLIDRDERERLRERMLPGIEQVKEGYERLSYIVLLLNEPGRKSKKPGYRRQNEKLYGRLVASSRETLMSKDEDALRALKEIIEEERKHGQGEGD